MKAPRSKARSTRSKKTKRAAGRRPASSFSAPPATDAPPDLLAPGFLEAGKEIYRTGYIDGWKAGWEAGLREASRRGRSAPARKRKRT